MLKDDKTYPYIKVTVGEEYPRVMLVRQMKKDKSKYFGPYTNGGVKDTIDLINKLYQLRTCNRRLPKDIGKERPCLNYHIGQCCAPCQGGVSQEEYNSLMIPVQSQQDEESGEEVIAIAPYQLAGMTFTAAYNDANAFLSRWHSTSTENCSGYSSSAFDILLDSAKASVSFEARDAYLHDAEAILLSDAPVIPVCCQCTSYQLSENLEGLYRSPNGVLFFSGINPVS